MQVANELERYDDLVAELDRLRVARAALVGEPAQLTARPRRISQEEVARYLIERPGSGPTTVAEALGVPYTTIASHFQRGKGDLFENRAGSRFAVGAEPAPRGSAGGIDQSTRTQPVTQVDLANGRIRIPLGQKGPFPVVGGAMEIDLRGRSLPVTRDPRVGPDRERSGVLCVPKGQLAELVAPDEMLAMERVVLQ